MFTKRRLITVLCTAFLAAAASFTALAGEARINFSDPSVTVGNEVNVTMKITADDGTLLSDATVVLKYSAEKLDFISGTDASGGAGAIRVSGTTNGGGSSLLEYNLKFATKSAGTASVSIDSYEIYDSAGDVVNVTHEGSSSISVNAVSDASADSTLSFLEVYPGELSPAFSEEIENYSVTVGTGVGKLTINAIPTDSSSSVTISGNEDLPDGDSEVVITVSAADGVNVRNYTLSVSKVAGGPENIIAEGDTQTSAEGVQLSSKGKTITIMDPGEDVEIPEGLRGGTIKIDDQKVQGWVWGADSDPEYCVVYGMNDAGEFHFYRYDMAEKTIQRYFEDPLAIGSVSNAEYQELASEKEQYESRSSFRLMVICVMAAICFVLIMVIIYLYSKLGAVRSQASSTVKRERKLRRDQMNSYGPKDDDTEFMRTDTAVRDDISLSHDFSPDEQNSASQPLDETQVIRRHDRKRTARRVEQGDDSTETLTDAFESFTDESVPADPVEGTPLEAEEQSDEGPHEGDQ